jgi:hypothetical protein
VVHDQNGIQLGGTIFLGGVGQDVSVTALAAGGSSSITGTMPMASFSAVA